MYTRKEFKDLVSQEREKLKEVNMRRVNERMKEARKSAIKSIRSGQTSKTNASIGTRTHIQRLSENLLTFSRPSRTSIRISPNDFKEK